MSDNDCLHEWHQTRRIKRAERCPLCDERSDGKADVPGEPRYAYYSAGLAYCEDCGVIVAGLGGQTAHTRFHAILGDHGRAVAMLLVAHIGPGVHDKYDVKDRFDAKRNNNNWSAEAFAEVTSSAYLDGAQRIADERDRQVRSEGWSSEHDCALSVYDALQLMCDELGTYEHFGPVEARAFEQARAALEASGQGRFVSGDAERIVELQRALHDLCDAFQQVYEAEYGPAPAGENGVYHHARRLLGETS